MKKLITITIMLASFNSFADCSFHSAIDAAKEMSALQGALDATTVKTRTLVLNSGERVKRKLDIEFNSVRPHLKYREDALISMAMLKNTIEACGFTDLVPDYTKLLDSYNGTHIRQDKGTDSWHKIILDGEYERLKL